MKKINHYQKLQSPKKSVVTIGTFDGLHIGHQKILKSVVQEAKKENLCSVLLTFFPHPRIVLQEKSEMKLIHTIDEKIELLKSTGIDFVIVQPFYKKFANLSAFDFVKNILVKHLNIKKLIIGYDHRFGKNRTGDFEELENYGKMFDFEVINIQAQKLKETTISSTKIRNAILNGQIQKANDCLLKKFSISGKVVKGKQIGQKLGFPTANIEIAENYKILPKNGVYKVCSFINEKKILGILNIGFRPTLQGKSKTIEVHFLDFKENLYGKNLKIVFLEFIREEKNFSNKENLRMQIQKDILKINSKNI